MQGGEAGPGKQLRMLSTTSAMAADWKVSSNMKKCLEISLNVQFVR